MTSHRPEGLLQWQYNLYTNNHQERHNLLIHIVTVPIFWLGSVLLISGLFASLWGSLLGLLSMIAAVAAQGRGHRKEANAPEPFLGPLDVVTRIVAEQWITFPRYVLSGGLLRAWRSPRSELS
jgi:hypothetical protein